MIDIFKKLNGEFNTKPEIVDLILDLVGYTVDKPLNKYRLLEPSSGGGAFIIQAIERLINATLREYGEELLSDEQKTFNILSNSIKSIELNNAKNKELFELVITYLHEKGFSMSLSEKLAIQWLMEDNFLFWNKPVKIKFDYIVGNPPYVRIENIDDELEEKYRQLYKTLFDRADIYVAFIEHSLEMLEVDGKMSFICTDRFTKNRYGREIRNIINENYRVLHYIDIHNTKPFVDDVSAYPCIFTIKNQSRGNARTIKLDDISMTSLMLAKDYLLNGTNITNEYIDVHNIDDWFRGSEPWILNGGRAESILNKLETNNTLLIDSPHNVKVGIGVATGATDIYIIDPNVVDIEQAVLLPVVTKDDITNGIIDWRGYYIINPYNEDGTLINLDDFPKLRNYFFAHRERLKSRSTAKSSPQKWYKTIDRIFTERLKQPKLLIPDIKSKNTIAKDDGMFYPEHSLYYITPGSWDIDVLQALLNSSITKFFIWSYATKMRGDYLRYQAQYLKRIRLPSKVSEKDCNELKRMNREGNLVGIDKISQRLYDLTDNEMQDLLDLVQ